MLTTYTIMRLDGTQEAGAIDWPQDPGLARIRDLVEPLLDGEPLARVSVVHNGRATDMFISEYGRCATHRRDPLPRNEAATAVYRTAALLRLPDLEPEALPWIAGLAILFDRRVWF